MFLERVARTSHESHTKAIGISATQMSVIRKALTQDVRSRSNKAFDLSSQPGDLTIMLNYKELLISQRKSRGDLGENRDHVSRDEK